jgi:protein kinase-like protein
VTSSLQDQVQRALGTAYLLERELGGGGMSRVFLALEHGLGRRVVVKVLLPELAAGVNVERFRREIQLAAQLQHPHIVPLLSAGEAEGLPYFIMPYVTGESLRARVTREGELPIAETVRILRDVVSALAYAHSSGVIHRDIKPDNVLISGGVAVVTDFGVAKAVTASSDSGGPAGLTSLGVALGTPAYMAPEQATASPNTDHRADIYAVGVMAYEMLTGAAPFSGRSAQQVLAAHVIEEPELVERRRPAVPAMLAAMVRECLAKRPADRPQTAAQVMSVLDAIVTPSGGTSATTAVRLPPAGQHAGRRRKVATWAASAAAIALLLGGLALWQQRTRQPTTPGASSPAQTATGTPSETVAAGSKAQPAPPPAPARSAPAQRPSVPPPKPKRARAKQPPTGAQPLAAPDSALSDSTPSAAVAEPAPVIAPAVPVAESTAAPAAPPEAPKVAAPPPAPRTADAGSEIRRVVAEYARAIESESVADLKRTYPSMTGLQQTGWEQFFQLVRDVQAQLSVARLDVAGDSGEGQITGSYTYLNTSTGRTENRPVSFNASFKQERGRWRISQVR